MGEVMPISEAQLDALKAGEDAAWSQLFADYSARLYRWSVMLGLRPADAEDATQEILAVAFRRVDTCRSARVLERWLYQVTRRVVANARRKVWLKRVFLSEEPPEPAFVHGVTTGREEELAVRACLTRIPQRQAEVLMLAEIEGYTRDEVAAMLDIAPGTVASRLRLGRLAFRRVWADQFGAHAAATLAWEDS
jgi:RNA polymerase sigma-70 factor, ECF subfamily